jgi:phage protein D
MGALAAPDRSRLVTPTGADGDFDTDTYAPRFEIQVGNTKLGPKVLADVSDVRVTLEKDQPAGFSLVLSNWDEENFDFKYLDDKRLDVGQPIQIKMGYADSLRSMIRGLITSVAPTFPESGQPTIAVSGVDKLVLLRDAQPSDGVNKRYADMTDAEIAERIAKRHGLAFKATTDGLTKQASVVQKNQDDASFLLERAKKIDFDVYIETDPDTGKDTLYFVKPTDLRDATASTVFAFAWGETLVSFTPELSVSRQVSAVTVRGWDPVKKRALVHTATLDDLPEQRGAGRTGPQIVEASLGAKEARVVDMRVSSEEQARALAQSLLRERAYQFLTGSGQVVGTPDLRPGVNVKLDLRGSRFSGDYYVTRAEHAIGASGYQTTFAARRGKEETAP